MKSRIGILGIGIMTIAMLCGCASIPEMTDAQTEVVSEYAASLLLKYDSENHSRLVDTKAYKDEYTNALFIYKAGEAEYYEKLAYEEEQRRQEALKEKEEAEKYASATGTRNDGTGGATIIDGPTDDVALADYLGCDGFSIEYSGYELMDSYPKDSSDDYFFTCVATKGSKLLVVYFDAVNLSSETNRLDVFNKQPKFKLAVNGMAKRDTLITLLEDDLGEYLGDFSGGESKKLVLIREISEDTVVNNVSMSVSVSDKNTINKILE